MFDPSTLFSKSKGEAFLTKGLQVLSSFIFNFMKNSPLKFEIQILILIFIHALYQMVNQWPMPVLYGHK